MRDKPLILLIDDEQSLIETLTVLLRGEGYEVIFELTGAGLSVSGYGTIETETRELDMTVVAIGAPEGKGIPILSDVVGWLLKGIERQLVRIDVTGTTDAPKYTSQVLTKVTWPLRSLRTVLFSPILGSSSKDDGSGG